MPLYFDIILYLQKSYKNYKDLPFTLYYIVNILPH